jgi:hypothetical protein
MYDIPFFANLPVFLMVTGGYYLPLLISDQSKYWNWQKVGYHSIGTQILDVVAAGK